MPMYDYECACGALFEQFYPIKEDSSTTTCAKCDGLAQKVFLEPPRVRADFEAYECPITGKEIRGKRAHAENLRRHDVHVLEPGEKEANDRRAREQEQALEARIGRDVEARIEQMDSKSLERLGAELSSGAEVNLVKS